VIAYETWGLTLVHFLWQGLLVAAVLLAALRALSHQRPEIRYAVSVAALVAMVASPAVTLWTLEAGGPERIVIEAGAGESPIDLGQATDDTAEADGPETPLPDAAGGPAGVTSVAQPAAAARGDRGFSGFFRRGRRAIQPFLVWIVGVWAGGVLALSVRLLGGWVRLKRLTSVDASPVPDAVRQTALDLAARLAVSRPVRLVRSASAAVPAVVGWLRPVILLPASALTGLTPAQLQAILAHELAHIRRHDYVINLLQTVVETLLFYHPAVWWVSSRIREEREHCCDDLAVTVCGDRRLYAGALLELETLRAPNPQLALAAGGGSLVTRVRRLVDPPGATREMLPRWSAALSTAAIATAMSLACGGDALFAPWRDDGASSVFIAEAFGTRVFRYVVTERGDAFPDGELTTNLSQPIGIAFSPEGEMFVSNRTGSIARYLHPETDPTPNGLITSQATGAPLGQPHFLTFRGDELFSVEPSGTVLRFTFDASGNASYNGSLSAASDARGITTNPATGEVLVSRLENAIHRFAFDISGVASSNGLITGGGLNHTHSMTFTPWGELLVANAYGNSVSRFVFDAAGNAVPNGIISGGGMAFPVDLDISSWGELFVTNHNQVPGLVTRWTFSSRDASAAAVFNGSFEVPANVTGIRFPTSAPDD